MLSLSDSSVPITQPIKTFKDLLLWQSGQDEYNVAQTPFHPRPPRALRKKAKSTSSHASAAPSLSAQLQPDFQDCKVIVCHDMAGGYQEDASPQGNDYSTIYNLQYWSHVDTFIYFSHHRIAMPPPVWTNAAHRNGVRCLGTIITEWLPGVMETDEMVSGPEQTLADEDGNDTIDRRWFSKTYANKLVDMAVYYKFDGWFINIESILRGGAAQANQLIAFLAYFRAQIHSRIPGGELIWYDSVISTTGELAWQDRLSPKNYRFFEQSDGIFTNYTWQERAVGDSVALAGSRNRDVYTGIDIWGRNTYGGGGYTTYKALEVIQREKSSCALFAPAWTYQSLSKDSFMTNDRLFWTGLHGAGIHAESLPLSEYFQTVSRLLTGAAGDKAANDKTDIQEVAVMGNRSDEKDFLPISAYIPSRISGTSTWFHSNFDRGFGKGFWINGKKVSDKPWSNLSHQSLAPSMTKDILVLKRSGSLMSVGGMSTHWILSPEEAYSGGTSLVIEEFTLRDSVPFPPTLPIPPLPPSSPPLSSSLSTQAEPGTGTSFNAAAISHPSSKTILVPLFDTQISLLTSRNSTVELIFKTSEEDVQVGLHLGLLATEVDMDDCRTFHAREISHQELSEALHPMIKNQVQYGNDSGLETDPATVLILTSENGDMTSTMKTVLTLKASLQGASSLYSIVPLAGGWRRLTLQLSSLFSDFGVGIDGGDSSDSSSIVLSQLGVTLTYTDHPANVASEVELRRPLATLGSFAVLPTWSMEYRGSSIQGVKDADRDLTLKERPPQEGLDHSLEPSTKQKTGIDVRLNSERGARISISTTLYWNIGFPISLSLPDNSKSTNNSFIPSYEYSHYCVYLSLTKRGHTDSIEVGQHKTTEDGNFMFVGTAFTTQYRISNFELVLEYKAFMPLASAVDQFALSLDTVANDVSPAEMFSRAGLELWVWVQGIFRDGRADKRENWEKTQLA
ncbi:hypothetical protein BGZ98_006743 [Dissophora globulifera]|nr:hypothetical protein BGZ98_006743 [Dissophora globulifera]